MTDDSGSIVDSAALMAMTLLTQSQSDERQNEPGQEFREDSMVARFTAGVAGVSTLGWSPSRFVSSFVIFTNHLQTIRAVHAPHMG